MFFIVLLLSDICLKSETVEVLHREHIHDFSSNPAVVDGCVSEFGEKLEQVDGWCATTKL